LSLFIAACGALLLLSALFYSLPIRPAARSEDLEQTNLDAFRMRQAELEAAGEERLQSDARLRLLEDEQQRSVVPDAPAVRPFPRWILLPLVAVISAIIYYQLGGAADVKIAQQLRGVDENTTAEQMAGLIDTIASRSEQRPENTHYMALLGRYYMGQEDYTGAARAYGELAHKLPEDAQTLAYAAQAQYLAAGRRLDDQARLLAEQALAVNPHQRTALGLLGMTSYEQGEYRAAIDYWERLVAVEPPGSETARMINGIIESARQKLGEAPAPAEPTVAATVTGAGITVQVALPEGAEVAPGDTVFVLARNADSDSRMPIAVQRLQAGQLPVTLRLDDSNSMAGQKLSDFASVLVLVQVSPDGRPGEANATWLGQAGPLSPAQGGEPLQIVLSPRKS
jgi:cytochrome c-type biogenesis protein CcmH